MTSMAVQVEEPSLWRKLFEFRYHVYVEQQGFCPPTADHSLRTLVDPLDVISASFALLNQGDVVGSLRLTRLDAIPDPAPFIQQLCMQPAVDAFGAAALCLSSRFMFHATKPATPKGMFQLLALSYSYCMKNGYRITYGNCSPHLLKFYKHMGYRNYINAYTDSVYGEKLPILLILGDRTRFVRVRSPLARCAASYPEDTNAILWFEEKYGASQSVNQACKVQIAAVNSNCDSDVCK
jgi:N-acyl-L-homoserine lactone synthetase